MKNKQVLVTGGSKGIGFAIAEEFSRNGHSLILVAWHQDDLEKAVSFLSFLSFH